MMSKFTKFIISLSLNLLVLALFFGVGYKMINKYIGNMFDVKKVIRETSELFNTGSITTDEEINGWLAEIALMNN